MQKSLNYAKRKLKQDRRKQATHHYAAIKNDAAKFQYMTGLPHPDVFDWILGLIKDKGILVNR